MGSHPQGRLFRFKGDDTQYREYLERELLQARKYIASVCPSSNFSRSPGGLRPSLADGGNCVAGKSGSQGQREPVTLKSASLISPPARVEETTDNTTCFAGNSSSKVELEFIPFDPLNPSVSPPTQDGGRWKTELNDLLSNIQETKVWGAPIPPEEIDGLLLRYQVQFNSESDEVHSSDKGDKGYDEPVPTSSDVPPEFYSWYKSYYAYAAHTSRALKRHSRAGSRLGFRVVIVSLMCIVLLDVGVPLDTVNSILKTCFPNPEKITPNTLREYRRGARWVNSRVLQLIEGGWSNRSAELFFRYGRSICQYKQICGNKKSEMMFITELRKKGKPVPPLKSDQMPISIPCIIKRYIGNYVSLERICEVLSYKNLSYNYEYTAWIYNRFYSPDSGKTAYPSPPPVCLSDDDTGEVESTTETQSSLMSPSGRSEGDISDHGPYSEGDPGDSETTSTPLPETNQRTDNLQVLVEAAETCAKQTNKRPCLAESDSRDSQRRRFSRETEGIPQDSSHSVTEGATESREQPFLENQPSQPDNDAWRFPWVNDTTLSSTAQLSTGTSFELDPNCVIDPLDIGASYQSPQRTIIRENTDTSIEYYPFVDADPSSNPSFLEPNALPPYDLSIRCFQHFDYLAWPLTT